MFFDISSPSMASGTLFLSCVCLWFCSSCVSFDQDTVDARRCSAQRPCAPGFRCEEAFCVRPDVQNPLGCTPNTGICNGRFLTPCGLDGEAINANRIDCTATGQICFAGQCVDSCSPGQSYCSGLALLRCVEPNRSAVVEQCPNFQEVCIEDGCRPFPPDCPISSARASVLGSVGQTSTNALAFGAYLGQTVQLDGSTSTAATPGETIAIFDWRHYFFDEIPDGFSARSLFLPPLPNEVAPTFTPARTGSMHVILQTADTQGRFSCEGIGLVGTIFASSGLRVELSWEDPGDNFDFDLHVARKPDAWANPADDCFWYYGLGGGVSPSEADDCLWDEVPSPAGSPRYLSSIMGTTGLEQVELPPLTPSDTYYIGVQAYEVLESLEVPPKLNIWLDDRLLASFDVPPIVTTFEETNELEELTVRPLWEGAVLQLGVDEPTVTPRNNVVQFVDPE